MHPHAARGENARVNPADIAQAQAAVILNMRHHQGNFVQMGAQHNFRSVALFVRNHAVHRVHRHLVHQRTELFGKVRADLRLMPADTRQRRYVGKQLLDIHRMPPSIVKNLPIIL
jgi:hypothetical protein